MIAQKKYFVDYIQHYYRVFEISDDVRSSSVLSSPMVNHMVNNLKEFLKNFIVFWSTIMGN
jgi:hypothetical protein